MCGGQQHLTLFNCLTYPAVQHYGNIFFQKKLNRSYELKDISYVKSFKIKRASYRYPVDWNRPGYIL
jgi:hypothetical protein